MRAVSVLYSSSIKVPAAIAAAKTRNKTAISRVEKRKENSFLSMTGDSNLSGTKILNLFGNKIENRRILRIFNK